MKAAKLWVLALVASATVGIVALGGNVVQAQEPTVTPVPEQTTPATPADKGEGPGSRGGRHGGVGGAALARALGITEAELEAAQAEARAAAIAQALAAGEITQEQADALRDGTGGRGFHFHGGRSGDHDALLAQALGITEAELQAARDEARATTLAAAVAAGEITQEQADLIGARHALDAYLDREAIVAAALGMSTAELQVAHDEGQRLSQIIAARGLDAATVQAAIQTGYEQAVARAVAEGVITQAQADAIGTDGRGFGFGGRGGPGRGGFRSPDAPSTTPGTTTETSGA